ncbi:hypothetical protein BpHYR1_036323 [Brachionus plicatilis]|uniref:Uncharacterized protein n=1 Tax=Brachionus plicatilis TaxID=10195 RepID=A0A3M7PVK9_BRAPC|nr:hypothetical protein BpHYR1_036323 [Brachionus plicatilis]
MTLDTSSTSNFDHFFITFIVVEHLENIGLADQLFLFDQRCQICLILDSASFSTASFLLKLKQTNLKMHHIQNHLVTAIVGLQHIQNRFQTSIHICFDQNMQFTDIAWFDVTR